MKSKTRPVREKLARILAERAKELNTFAKNLRKGEELSQALQLMPYEDYEDYLDSLDINEKQEFLKEISSDKELLSTIFAWVENSTIKELLNCATGKALIFQQLSYERFAVILHELEMEVIYQIFCDSFTQQKFELMLELTEDEMTKFLSFICKDGKEKAAKDMLMIAETIEAQMEENDVTEIENKLFEAIFRLESWEQALIITNIPAQWLDAGLEKISITNSLPYMSAQEIVAVMLGCNREHFKKLFKIQTSQNLSFDWTSVEYEKQMRILSILVRENFDVTRMFDISRLVQLYCDGNEVNRRYVLFEVLPRLEQEEEGKVQSYKEFYQGIENESDKTNFLKLHYEKVRDIKAERIYQKTKGSILDSDETFVDIPLADVIIQMLNGLEYSTTEEVYLEAFEKINSR